MCCPSFVAWAAKLPTLRAAIPLTNIAPISTAVQPYNSSFAPRTRLPSGFASPHVSFVAPDSPACHPARSWRALRFAHFSLALAQLAQTSGGRLLAVITAHPLDAQRLQEEIAWFAPGLRVHLLPDWETLPYDSLSPHHDLISERLATLYEITRGQCDIALIAYLL